MTVVKRLSMTRRVKIEHKIEKALLAITEVDQPEIALKCLDTAMKLFNGKDDAEIGLRYDELNDACEAFLEETKFPSLTVALNYIAHWREQEQFIGLGKAVYEAGCDMAHYWRCEAWQLKEGERRKSDPLPSDEKCTCGLREIVEAENKIVVKEGSE